MKKVIFGLIATILMSVSSFANDTNVAEPNYEPQIIECEASVIENEIIVEDCVTVSVGISVFISVSVDVRVCCWRKSAHSPKYDCSFTVLKKNETARVYIDLADLGEESLRKIRDERIKELTIERSGATSLGNGLKLQISKGTYRIVEVKGEYFAEVEVKAI